MKNAVVVGLGIGMAHAAGYLNSPHAKLYGVCDLTPQRTSRISGTFDQGSLLCLKPLFLPKLLEKTWEEAGVKVFSSLDAVLSDPMVDIVSLCTPDYLHPEHLKMTMAAKKHILLEKPVSIHLDQALELTPEAETYPKSIGINYEFRINPAVKKLRELMMEGWLGDVKGFSLYHFRTPFRQDKWKNWIQKQEFSGGLIIEETCHWLDLARFLTGKEAQSIHCVTAGGINSTTDFEDIAYINGTYKEGGIFQISHVLTGFDFSLQICLHGTRGTAWCGLKDEEYTSLDGGSSSHLGIVSFGEPGGTPDKAKTWTWGKEASEPWNIHDMAGEFAAQVSKNLPPAAGWNDGLASLKMADAAIKSAKTGDVILLDD